MEGYQAKELSTDINLLMEKYGIDQYILVVTVGGNSVGTLHGGLGAFMNDLRVIIDNRIYGSSVVTDRQIFDK